MTSQLCLSRYSDISWLALWDCNLKQWASCFFEISRTCFWGNLHKFIVISILLCLIAHRTLSYQFSNANSAAVQFQSKWSNVPQSLEGLHDCPSSLICTSHWHGVSALGSHIGLGPLTHTKRNIAQLSTFSPPSSKMHFFPISQSGSSIFYNLPWHYCFAHYYIITLLCSDYVKLYIARL